MIYTVHNAKTQLSRLIEEAEQGREVVIARGKTPVARLVAMGAGRKRRTPGRFKDCISIKPSFDEPLSKAALKEWGIE